MEQKIFIDPTRKFNNKTKPVNDKVSIKKWLIDGLNNKYV